MEIKKTYTFQAMDLEFWAYIAQDHTIWVALPEVCAVLGIDPDYQENRMIEGGEYEPVTDFRLMNIPGEFRNGQQTQTLFCLSIECIPMWLLQLRPHLTQQNVKDKHEVFVRETFQRLGYPLPNRKHPRQPNRPSQLPSIL